MPKPRIDENLLFEAALEEFTEHSYKEASLNRIMKNAGISKGSFYYRFENKYQLYLYLLQEANRKKWDFIRGETKKNEQQPAAEQGVPPQSDIFSLFLNQAELGIRFASAYPKLYKLAKMFSREKGTEVYADVLEALSSEDESDIEGMIDAAFESGEFSERYSREFVVRVLGFLFRSYDEIFPHSEDADSQALLSDMKNFVTFLQFGLADSSP